MTTPIELRPRGIGEILDAAFTLYTRNIKKLLAVAALVLLPIGLLQLLLAQTVGSVNLTDLIVSPEGELPAGFGSFAVASLGSSLLGVLGTLLVQGASIPLYAGAYQSQTVGWAESLSFALRKAVPILAVALLWYLTATLALFPFVLPGIWLWVSFYVAIPALLVEHGSPIQSMGRSFRLVRGRWWEVFGVAALALLITAVINWILSFIVSFAVVLPGIFSAIEGSDLGTGRLLAASTLAGAVGGVFTAPFAAAVAVSTYFDLRVRRDGYDLEMMALELGGDALPDSWPAPPPPVPDLPDEPPQDPFGLDDPR